VSDQLDERAQLELKFRQEWAAEARAERELFVVALFFF
jgi:hypothetical protein